MCDCNKDVLDKVNANYKYSFSLVLRETCSCRSTVKKLICQHCKQFLRALNFSALKVFVKKKICQKSCST